jgi:flagellar hook-associated protein 2
MRLPGLSALDPKLVEGLIEAERIPIDQVKKRREKVVEEKTEFEKLNTMLTELDTAATSLKTKADFYKMKVESSHPDIMEGTVSNAALLGNYEFEVRSMARNEKELAFGFPDKDKTPVGFGYMLIEREDMEPAEVIVEPGATLQDVAQQINDAQAGVRAMVINTKFSPDSYRLVVISEKSGTESRISIDPDTTFMEFKEQVTGKSLDVLFEDVPVTDDDNILDELVEGVSFNVKRAEPGTRIQINVVNDLDLTMESIKGFVDKYNQIVKFAAAQSQDPTQGDPGRLSGDASVRQVMRQLQGAVSPVTQTSGKYRTLADVGIITNAKTGELQMDDTKVRAALSEDYDGVAQLFIRTNSGDGLGERIAERLKTFRDPAAGVIKSRIRGIDKIIENQDKDIVRRERALEDKEQAIKRRFASLEGQMNDLQAQGSFLSARLGGQQGGGQG